MQQTFNILFTLTPDGFSLILITFFPYIKKRKRHENFYLDGLVITNFNLKLKKKRLKHVVIYENSQKPQLN